MSPLGGDTLDGPTGSTTDAHEVDFGRKFARACFSLLCICFHLVCL
jgi:hypothetical protein